MEPKSPFEEYLFCILAGHELGPEDELSDHLDEEKDHWWAKMSREDREYANLVVNALDRVAGDGIDIARAEMESAEKGDRP